MNLYCTPVEAIGVIGAMAFLGAALACFFLPALGDLYGRYNVFMVTSVLQLPLYIANNYTTNIGTLYVVCFFFGVALIGRFTCGFVLLTESLCSSHKAIAGTVLLTMDVAATLYVTVYIRFIAHNTQSVIWIGMALNIISFIANLWSVETPAWLLAVGDIEQAKKNLRYIAKFNGVQDYSLFNLVPDPEEGDAESDNTRELEINESDEEI